MAEKKKKWISLMIVPEDGAHVRSWRISARRYRLLKVGIGAVVFFLAAGFVSFVSASYLFYQIGHYRQMNQDLIEASSKLEVISARIADYEQKEANLRRVMGADIKLPAPMVVQESGGDYEVAEATDSGSGLYELKEAIAREEDRVRRIPTVWPVDAWQITKEFTITGNTRTDHLGLDLLAYEKSPVIATANGRVTFAGESPDLGFMIEIDHGNGWTTRYGHNATLLVSYGDEVIKGQTIAIYGGVDASGSGPHLHYAMYYNKKPVNPLDYLEPTTKMSILKKND